MTQNHKNIVFTNHAEQRMKLRRITPEMVVSTLQKPDDRELESDGDTKFIKTIQGRKVQVIGAYLEAEKKWLVKSAWVRGEDDPKPVWLQLIQALLRMIGIGKNSRRR